MSKSKDDSSIKNYEDSDEEMWESDSEPSIDSDEEGMAMYGVPFKFDSAKAIDALARMIIMDGQPLSYVQTPSFKLMMMVGCPPTFSVPSEKGIIKECFKVYAKERGKLMSYFSKSKPRVSLSVDGWSSRKGLPFMRVAAHYVDKKWKLQKKLLSFVPVDGCKGEEIRDMIEKCLREWGIDKVFNVTLDSESAGNGKVQSLLEALNKGETGILGGAEHHLRCETHLIKLMVGECLKEMRMLITCVREAVKYFKKHHEKLRAFKACVDKEKIECEKLMNLDDPRHWNSVYVMLDTGEKYERAFKRYARQDDRFQREVISGENPTGVPVEADWVNVRRLVKFLKPFYDLTLVVSESVSPTIHLHFTKISEADHLLQKWERDEDVEVKSFAKKMRGIFEKYWGDPSNMNVNIFIAAVMDPRVKFDFVLFLLVSMYGDFKGKEFGEKVKRECYKLFEEHKSLAPPSENEGCIGNTGESYMVQRWNEYMAYKAEICGSSENSELDKYLNEANVEYDDDFDILNWWKQNSQKFPILASMACDVLAVPVSTVVLESDFRMGYRIVDESRSSLEPKLADALICAQSWLLEKPEPISIEGDASTWDELEELGMM